MKKQIIQVSAAVKSQANQRKIQFKQQDLVNNLKQSLPGDIMIILFLSLLKLTKSNKCLTSYFLSLRIHPVFPFMITSVLYTA